MQGKFQGNRSNMFDGKEYNPDSIAGSGFSIGLSYGIGTVGYWNSHNYIIKRTPYEHVAIQTVWSGTFGGVTKGPSFAPKIVDTTSFSDAKVIFPKK